MAKGLKPNNRRDGIFNLLSFSLILATLCVIAVYAGIFINPTLPFNPFPPREPDEEPTPTATSTSAVSLPATWTPTALPATATPAPTETATLIPTETPVPEPTVEPLYIVQEGNPAVTSNFANDQECAWAGIAGQVFDLNSTPILGLTLRLEGFLGDTEITLSSITGEGPGAYGPAAYEFVLGDGPVRAEDALIMQIFDTETDIPLSVEIILSTSDSCDENLILVNWTQINQEE